ncbi:MAG: hypothetical protein V3R97_01510 [Gemmatimonadales bacterium]
MRSGAFIAAPRAWLWWIAILVATPSVVAQTPSWTRLPSLRFFGFRAGISLQAAAGRVDDLSGTALACERSTVDREVMDCRATFPDPVTADPVVLWLSARDSLVAILTISGPVSSVQFQAWRSSLVSAYGETTVVQQGSQSMLQWIRHRQMLRLTWRKFSDSTAASVSLIDGPLLDGWGRRGEVPAP